MRKSRGYASEWAWHVESRAWYAEVTGYTATTVHVHFGPLLAGGVRRTNLLPTPIASCSPSNPLLAGGVRRTNLLPTPIASCSPSNLMFSESIRMFSESIRISGCKNKTTRKYNDIIVVVIMI